MHQRADGDYFGSCLANQVHHVSDDLAGAHNIIDKYALESLSVEVLAKVVASVFLFGPEYLIGIKRFAYAECYRYAACGGSNYSAIRKRGEHVRLSSKQPR